MASEHRGRRSDPRRAPPRTRTSGPPRLTTLHAVGQALAIGPIFSVGLISGLVANVAGYSTPLSVLLGSVGALGLAYVISIYARRFAGAGAIFEYLSQAVHNSFGIFSAGVYLLGTLFLGAGGIFIALGFLVQGFFASHLSTSIPWWPGGAAALVDHLPAQPLRRAGGHPRRAHAGSRVGGAVRRSSRWSSSPRAATAETRWPCSAPAAAGPTPSSTGSCSR